MDIYQQDTHIQPDVFQVDFGSCHVLDLLADIWSILVPYALDVDTVRLHYQAQ